MPTTTTTKPAPTQADLIAKARRKIETLLEENALGLDREKRRINSSIEVISDMKDQRKQLLTLLRMHGGDAEQYELGEEALA